MTHLTVPIIATDDLRIAFFPASRPPVVRQAATKLVKLGPATATQRQIGQRLVQCNCACK